MNYAKFRLLVSYGKKLFFPIQIKKLTNYAAYKLKLKHNPLNVLLSVTSRCNKNCSFCYFSGELNQPNSKQLEMSYKRFIEILNHSLVKNSLRIHLTGGEPLLNKDVFKMIREAKKRKHIVSVGTNGILLKNFANDLLESPPDLLSVSYNPEDREKLISALPLFKGKIPLKLNFVMTKDNIKDLDSLIQVAIENHVEIIDINQLHYSQANRSSELQDKEYWELRDIITKKYGKKLLISWTSRNTDKKIKMKCKVFWHSIHIDTLGQISPCCQYPISSYQGNIFTNDEWNSDLMKSLRQSVKEGKTPEICKNCQTVSEDYMGL
jgi:MoaA/NifB/PqqE/SkfB family radical SAM enzyme